MADFTVHSSLDAVSVNTSGVASKGMSVVRRIAMLNFDGDAGGNQVVATYHEMMPSALSEGTGIIVTDIYGIITEIVAQGTTVSVFTIRDTASSPNTLATLTLTDAGALGSKQDAASPYDTEWPNIADNTDITLKSVAAGLGVEAALTTAGVHTGTVTGRCLICIEYLLVPRRIGEI